MLPIATTDLKQAKRDLDQSGVCVISGVLTGKALMTARRRLVEQAEEEERQCLDFRDAGSDQKLLDDFGQIKSDAFSKTNGGINQRLWMLVNKGQCFRDMVEHPLIDELIGHVLGDRFILSTHSANIAKRGGQRMGLHTDQ